jgi:hypothetical protein
VQVSVCAITKLLHTILGPSKARNEKLKNKLHQRLKYTLRYWKINKLQG